MNSIEPIHVAPELLDPRHAVGEIEVPGAELFRRGKVRSVYEAGEQHYVIVASDRLSAS